jgi:CheY-like chemotaxis protein/GAF domain-containing protein
MEPQTRNDLHGGFPAFLLEEIGDGIGVVDSTGEMLWMNQRLEALSPETMRRFCDCCRDLLAELARDGVDRRTHLRSFRTGDRSWEVAITPLIPGGDLGAATRAVGVLHDVTNRQRVLDRVDSVDAAGADLLALDAKIVNPLNVADRLRLIEGKIVDWLERLFGAKDFEVRLLDNATQRLELVTSRGIAPLPPGRFLHASHDGNGISGRVAADGEPYLCVDAATDPLYVAGLEGGRSSMTVPLLLNDKVVGVLNVESRQEARFDDEDLLCLELFGRYVAMALNILDMLVVERYTTNQRVSGALRDEIAAPVNSIRDAVDALKKDPDVPPQAIADLERAIATVENRVRGATGGPQTVLGVDRLDRSKGVDPELAGRRVAVLDDEAPVRDVVANVLAEVGASVDRFTSSAEGCDAIERAAAAGTPFDVVISDVRMPERNGYEVFRVAKAACPRTQVILMTGFGYDPNHSIVRSTQEGLHCFLFKPFQAQQLVDEVRKAVAEWKGERPLSER